MEPSFLYLGDFEISGMQIWNRLYLLINLKFTYSTFLVGMYQISYFKVSWRAKNGSRVFKG